MRTLIIIPAYNESDCIQSVVNSIKETGHDYIVVNDGSTDNTLEICERYGINHIDLRENLGIGGAVQAGHKYAIRNGYDIDIQFDGDGQHDARYIDGLIAEIEKGSDLAIGSRFLKRSDGFQSTFLRRAGIKWIVVLIRVFCKNKVSDPTSGFRACGKKAIELFSKDYPIDYPEPESIVSAYKNGLRVAEIPVTMFERKSGISSIKALSSIYYMVRVTLAIAILGITRVRD